MRYKDMQGYESTRDHSSIAAVVGYSKAIFTHSGDWFRGLSMMHKHLYHFAHSVVWRLTPWLTCFPVGEATHTNAAYYEKVCSMPNIVATINGTHVCIRKPP